MLYNILYYMIRSHMDYNETNLLIVRLMVSCLDSGLLVLGAGFRVKASV